MENLGYDRTGEEENAEQTPVCSRLKIMRLIICVRDVLKTYSLFMLLLCRANGDIYRYEWCPQKKRTAAYAAYSMKAYTFFV